MFLSVIKHEIKIQLKNIHNLIHALVFLLITTSIFAISINVENSQTSIAIIWICLIFAILLANNSCFQKDFDDGTFEQLFLSGYVFELIIFAKIFANWLASCLSLIVILPIVALTLKVDSSLIFQLLTIAAIATLIINFMVAFGSSLTLSANATSLILTILILPLLIPIIIFANSAFNNDFLVAVKFLLALLVFLIPLLTLATTASVRININD